MTEDEMVGWHHGLNGHEFEETQGDSEGRGGLGCCGPCGCRALYTTWQLNNIHFNSCLCYIRMYYLSIAL